MLKDYWNWFVACLSIIWEKTKICWVIILVIKTKRGIRPIRESDLCIEAKTFGETTADKMAAIYKGVGNTSDIKHA